MGDARIKEIVQRLVFPIVERGVAVHQPIDNQPRAGIFTICPTVNLIPSAQSVLEELQSMSVVDTQVLHIARLYIIRGILIREPIIEEVDGGAVGRNSVDYVIGVGRLPRRHCQVVAFRAANLNGHSKG